MKVIHANKSNTVGIITDPNQIWHIGTFTPALLKEWYKMVADMYGEEQEIHLFVRKSDLVDAYVIYASSNGENPFVAVTGHSKTDGTPWEQRYAE